MVAQRPPQLPNFTGGAAGRNLCFSNAVFQAILAYSGTREYFLGLSDSSLSGGVVTDQIIKVLRDGGSLSLLRHLIGSKTGKDYSAGNQEEADEFYERMLRALRMEGHDTFVSNFTGGMEVVERGFDDARGCKHCHNSYYYDHAPEVPRATDKIDIDATSFVGEGGQGVHLRRIIGRHYEHASELDLKCNNCCRCASKGMQCKGTGICADQKGYQVTKLLAVPNFVKLVRETVSPVMAVPDFDLDLGGSKYILKAVVNFHGTDAQGHYTAKVKYNHGWLTLDDDRQEQFIGSLGSKSNRMFFYEKADEAVPDPPSKQAVPSSAGHADPPSAVPLPSEQAVPSSPGQADPLFSEPSTSKAVTALRHRCWEDDQRCAAARTLLK
jgi:hypothetical protein